jgi:protein-tyrosine phosphatase
MIDFHIHILPGLDDGASYWEETMSMAKAAVTDGTTAVVATPHYIGMHYHNTKEKVNRVITQFREFLAKAELPLEVYSASEVQLAPEIPQLLAEGVLPTVNDTNYLLVELPFGEHLANSEPVLAKLREMGLTPILAHPERHREIRENPQWLTTFIHDGGVAQVNTASLNGDHGKDVQGFANQLVQGRLVHLVGSDSHGLLQRKPGLSKGLEKILQLAGEEWADFMVHKCPQQILAGKPVGELSFPSQQQNLKDNLK